jgi:hypothetical protein
MNVNFFGREMVLIFLIFCCVFVINSCGPKQADDIADAQACLNQAVASEVDECLTKIDGIETVAAYGLRCAGAFIKEGFLDPTVFIDSLNSIGDSGLTSSGFAQAMGLITFNNETSIAANNANAEAAFNVCYLSEGKATTFLASFGYFSTAIALYGSLQPDGDYNNSDSPSVLAGKLAIALATAVLDTEDTTLGKANLKTAIGSIIISTYQLSCSGATQIDEATCAKFESAIKTPSTSSEARVVGDRFISGL